jgi:ribosomal protein S18 acetylase RimI-like enzyme
MSLRSAMPRSPGPHAIRLMRLSDYDAVHRIWRTSEGMCLGDDDSRPRIRLYLARNRGLCFVATCGDRIVGTVLCGHDGRRGILRHLAVLPKFRRRGIGKALADKCLLALAREGIRKCNLFVMDNNSTGLRYWERRGYALLDDDYRTLQKSTGSE